MPKESKNFEFLLQERLKKFDSFLDTLMDLQDDVMRLNRMARHEIMMTQKLLFDYSRTYSKNVQENLK